MKRYLYIVLIALLMTSCTNPKKIRVLESAGAEVVTGSKLEINCVVENCTAYKLQIINGKFTLRKGNENFAVIMLDESVTIPKCAVSPVKAAIRFRFTDPLQMLTAANLESFATAGLTATGEAVVKTGLGKRKIKISNYPLSEFLTIFEVRE